MKPARIPTENQMSLPLPRVSHLDAECPWCFGSGVVRSNDCCPLCQGIGFVTSEVAFPFAAVPDSITGGA
jgi:DnaJ-class molecular chaperone